MYGIRKPSEEAIRQRAYDLFLDRGCDPAKDEEDWFAAEEELTIKLLIEDTAFAQRSTLRAKKSSPPSASAVHREAQ